MKLNKYDRYLKIVRWATDRYMVDNTLIISKGFFPSRYKIIEDIAAEKLLGLKRVYPDLTIKQVFEDPRNEL